MMKRLRDHEKMEPSLEFLREHGSSDVLTMKMAGIEIPHGLVNRMHSEGLPLTYVLSMGLGIGLVVSALVIQYNMGEYELMCETYRALYGPLPWEVA